VSSEIKLKVGYQEQAAFNDTVHYSLLAILYYNGNNERFAASVNLSINAFVGLSAVWQVFGPEMGNRPFPENSGL
jgi:hypothetical protein